MTQRNRSFQRAIDIRHFMVEDSALLAAYANAVVIQRQAGGGDAAGSVPFLLEWR